MKNRTLVALITSTFTGAFLIQALNNPMNVSAAEDLNGHEAVEIITPDGGTVALPPASNEPITNLPNPSDFVPTREHGVGVVDSSGNVELVGDGVYEGESTLPLPEAPEYIGTPSYSDEDFKPTPKHNVHMDAPEAAESNALAAEVAAKEEAVKPKSELDNSDSSTSNENNFVHSYISWLSHLEVLQQLLAQQSTSNFTEESEVVNGWNKENGVWVFYSQGKKSTGWIKDEGLWYYLNNQGEMQTGWIKYNGEWYFLTHSGAMATGWIYDNGFWYYLKSNGAMAANETTPDGYKVDSTGAWIK